MNGINKKLKILLVVGMVLIFLAIRVPPLPTNSTSDMELDLYNKISNSLNQTTLNHGIPKIAFFTNTSLSHNWFLENIPKGKVIFFSIAPDLNYNVTLFNPSGTKFEIERQIHPTKFLGVWKASVTGTWKLQVDYTNNIGNGNVSYNILVSMPRTGFDETSAIGLDESISVGNFTVDHETQYWKTFLHDNQNATIILKETKPSVLYDAEIAIYQQGHPQNPVYPQTKFRTGSDGYWNYSWNAYSTDTYYVVIRHNPQDVSSVGEYNISLIAERDLYSFETAGKLFFNQTVSIRVNQGFSPRKPFYFWFMVNSSRANVFIRVFGPDSAEARILEDATVEIFDGGKQERPYIGEEYNQIVDKQFNISLKLNEAGKYYLKVSPLSNAVGKFYIYFEYSLPKPFVWSFPSIILTILLLGFIPSYLIYLDSKGKWYRMNQWSVPTSLPEIYKILGNSLRGIFKIKEVPNTSILIPITNIPFKTFGILNFIESSEKETLVISKRLHRKYEWFLYILIGLIIFDVLNLLGFSLFSIHLLPFDVPNSTALFIVLIVPTMILTIIVLIVNVSSYISYSQVVDRISYVILNYPESSHKQIISQSLDPNQALKNINYVRVLWNQAKHAFKENNYELFVIKADAAVKNLLSTRFQQLVLNSIYSKPDFQFQVVSLRKRGFDLPSEKKIAHFRNLRNRIVHSSITLDEKESVDCFDFYSTFIARLGLRSG
ncbi:MAG: hypothetical protein ACFFB2_06965 [Promethearchaeota archaeon]